MERRRHAEGTDRPPARRPAGFTIVEMLVYLVVAGLVVGALCRLMLRQGRGYAQHVAAGDVDESARSTGVVLGWELRHAAAAGDTLSAIGAQTLTLRSIQAVGIVCAKHASLPRYGIWLNGGRVDATPDDSVLVFAPMSETWRQLQITQVGTPAALGVPACEWPGSRVPDLVIAVSVGTVTDTVGITVGSALRAFRKSTYGEFLTGGRWWVGRKTGIGPYERLTGPVLAPGSNGLEFRYYDALGATTIPSAVTSVEFTVRSESYRKYRDLGGVPVYRHDSLTSRIALRR